MSTLEKVTNFGIILVCCAVVSDIAYRNFGPRTADTAASSARRPDFREYKAGEALEQMPGFVSRPGTRSLLLVVRSTCGYCAQSIPFYQRLVQEVRTGKSPVQLVGVCLEASDACAAYFKSHNLTMDVTVGVAPGSIKVAGTPTLLLVNDVGKVTSVWTGLLPENGQRAVLDAIAGKPGNS